MPEAVTDDEPDSSEFSDDDDASGNNVQREHQSHEVRPDSEVEGQRGLNGESYSESAESSPPSRSLEPGARGSIRGRTGSKRSSASLRFQLRFLTDLLTCLDSLVFMELGAFYYLESVRTMSQPSSCIFDQVLQMLFMAVLCPSYPSLHLFDTQG